VGEKAQCRERLSGAERTTWDVSAPDLEKETGGRKIKVEKVVRDRQTPGVGKRKKG